MVLKDYQQSALNDLRDFLTILDKKNSLSEAYKIFWEDRDVPANPSYQNIISGVPQVCFKVPTGGGKTLMAAASLKIICEHITSKIIVWLVPSETILTQTYKNLSDATHPYRKKIHSDFDCNIEIYTKEQLLAGENFSPTEILNQLSILVLSYDSFRKKSKEFYKVFQENERLEKFSSEFDEDENFLLEAEKNSLIQIIRHYKPIIIVDESHHARTNLSVEMLKNFSPSFILELTATPKENSNVITYVPAWKLKSEGMVKLPVIVYNRHTQKEVISDAISFRERLEKISSAEKIRPIILFQAESKGKGDRATFDKIKDELIKNFEIPAEQIAIKTAEINDLKNIDLMAADCPIRFIITVNALKEGWDCPFAYILASLANRNSAVDVEQILGRILRRPFTKNFSERKLNMSYVFTASADFRQTLEKIIVGLNSAGFSENEYRAVNEVEEIPEEKNSVEPLQLENLSTDEKNISEEKISDEKNSVDKEFEEADKLGDEYEEKFKNSNKKNARSVEEQNKMTEFFMREKFRGEKIILPQFFYRGESNLFEAQPDVKVSKEMLCENFSLKDKDTEIDFENLNYEIVSVDLHDEENIPQYQLLNERDAKVFMNYFKNLPTKSQVRQCAEILSQKIDKKKNLPSSAEIKKYVRRIVENFSGETIFDAMQHIEAYKNRIENKIEDFVAEHSKKIFISQIESKKIFAKPSYELPEKISPTNFTKNISKSLYSAELNDMNKLEYKIITKISSLENVLWWHRIRVKKEFYINGFINHYPDFLVMTTSGILAVVEVKGDDRDNSDSKRKLQLGQLWEKMSGFDKYSYFMVFDEKPLDGALSFNDFISTLKNL